MPKTRPSRPAEASATPGRSSCGAGPWLSWSRRAASGISARPIGTLSQKIHCHEMPSITAPPISGPSATPSPLTPDQTPSARPRRSAGTAVESSVRLSGAMIAAPRPWTARAAISVPVLGASAAAADAAVNSASPATNMRRRPKRSPSAAPVRRKTAKASVYALTVHSSASSDAPRSMRMLVSAFVTTRLSRATMKMATELMRSGQSGMRRDMRFVLL